jgi:hypothetical protein
MTVRAIDEDYDNITVRQAGDVFDMVAGSEAPGFQRRTTTAHQRERRTARRARRYASSTPLP